MAGESEVVVSPAAQGIDREPDQLVRDILDSARAARGLTRKSLAEELGVHARTLRNWMQAPAGLTAEQIERLCACLPISAENRANLRLLTGQRSSMPTASALKGTPEIEVYQRLIDGCSHPSLVTDHAAENIIWNDAFRDVFGGVTPHRFAHPMRSGLKYILFHPKAYQMLGGGDMEAFREGWLMHALANFSAALEQHPDDENLLMIEREIARRPGLRKMYAATPAWIFQCGDIHTHPSPRPFRDPRTDELTTVQVVTQGHRGYQPFTLTHVSFIVADAPSAPQVAGDSRPARAQGPTA
ncbi:helix-turn-helix domain-containing protein [Streptomyces sp. NBC_00885]|uniref:helix-turn-helix domain-containing protein n=1 Tax=Streptomyces sp. NBC_00885 TaxID=2975857 RepID=UPI003870A046|nr:helix-turn-helix domain-containing protein [Streptomyces sp. NBC_00885]